MACRERPSCKSGIEPGIRASLRPTGCPGEKNDKLAMSRSVIFALLSQRPQMMKKDGHPQVILIEKVYIFSPDNQVLCAQTFEMNVFAGLT